MAAAASASMPWREPRTHSALKAQTRWAKVLTNFAADAPALGRPATADEIAEAIIFLATDRF